MIETQNGRRRAGEVLFAICYSIRLYFHRDKPQVVFGESLSTNAASEAALDSTTRARMH